MENYGILVRITSLGYVTILLNDVFVPLDASETTKPNVKWEDCMGLEKIKDALKESTDQPGKKCQGILLYGVSKDDRDSFLEI